MAKNVRTSDIVSDDQTRGIGSDENLPSQSRGLAGLCVDEERGNDQRQADQDGLIALGHDLRPMEGVAMRRRLASTSLAPW